jgi:hypothetical protein
VNFVLQHPLNINVVLFRALFAVLRIQRSRLQGGFETLCLACGTRLWSGQSHKAVHAPTSMLLALTRSPLAS